MEHEYDVEEAAYDMYDPEEAYYDHDVGADDDEDGDYIPGLQGVDDHDDDDEDGEEDEEDEELDRQLDAEDAMEAMQDLQDLTEAEENYDSGQPTVTQILDALISDSGAETIRTDNNSLRIENISVDGLNRVMNLLRRPLRGVRILPNSFNRNQGDRNREEEEEDQPRPTRRSTRILSVAVDDAPAKRSKTPDWWMKAHTEPQQVGQNLLMSGEFGEITSKLRGTGGRSQNMARIIRERTMSTRPMSKEDLCEPLFPNSHGTVVASYPANVYCGQFSFDSSFYYVCCKDFNLHIYDMLAQRPWSDRPGRLYHDAATGHRTTMSVHKSIRGIADGWTVTDSHLSPDNERMVYSSMGSAVYMVKTLDYNNTQTPIFFSDPADGNRRNRTSYWGDNDDDYIWSCRFSADGNEIIAGGRGVIYVYDLLAAQRTVKIRAHHDDVNSCCWADSGSNVLISASDDTFIKVWDRRSLGSSPKPSGVLIGHTEGITNVSAKGDGRYVISNGKDQALRLWDLRKMRTNEEYESVRHQEYGLRSFDYRYSDNRKQKIPAHPKNCSIMTYRGHMVMRTLIRCHFSPAESTGGAYIYSGSTDGRIHIWSLDGRIVQVLERSKTFPITTDPSGEEYRVAQRNSASVCCVRDVSWHSKEPVLLSAAWGENHSTVARHEWKGLNKMNYNLADWVEKNDAEERERQSRPYHSMRSRLFGLTRAFAFDDNDSD